MCWICCCSYRDDLFWYGDNRWTIWWLCDMKDADYRDNHNVIGTRSLTVKKAWQVRILFAVAAVVGLVLVARTNILLFVGAICFFIGVFYTFGPIPISRCLWWSVNQVTKCLDFLITVVFKCARRNGLCRRCARRYLTMQLDPLRNWRFFYYRYHSFVRLPISC